MADGYTSYGGDAAALLFTVDTVTGDIKPAAAGTAGVWTAPTAGAAITDLLDASDNAISHITAAADGTYRYQARDGLGTLYVDSGLASGVRFASNPTALGSLVAGLVAGAGDTDLTAEVAAATAAATAATTTATAASTAAATATSSAQAASAAAAGADATLATQAATLTAQASSIAALQSAVAALQSGGSSAPTADAPTNVAVTPGDGQLVATWSASASSSHTITAYQASLWPTPAQGAPLATVNTDAATLTATFTGLTNGQSYDVEVCAVMAQDNGTLSGPVSATPVSASSGGGTTAPTVTGTSVTDTTLTVTWSAGVEPSGPITGYGVFARIPGASGLPASSTYTSDPAVLTATLTGLTAGTTYNLNVRNETANGDKTDGPTVQVTTTLAAAGGGSPPAEPTALAAQPGPASGQVTLTWVDAVPETGVANYHLEYAHTDASSSVTVQVLPPGTTSYVATGLDAVSWNFGIGSLDSSGTLRALNGPATATPPA